MDKQKIALYSVVGLLVLVVAFLLMKKENYMNGSTFAAVTATQDSGFTPVVTPPATNSLLSIDSTGNLTAVGGLPIGSIIMWNGATAPAGWAVCDGTNGTPDLRSRFVVGASSGVSAGSAVSGGISANNTAYPPGYYGGEEAHELALSTDGGPAGSTMGELPNKFANAVEWLSGGQGTAISVLLAGDQTAGPHNNMPPFYSLLFIMKISD